MTLIKMVKNIFLIFVQESCFGNYTVAFTKALAIELSQKKLMKNIEIKQCELIEVE